MIQFPFRGTTALLLTTDDVLELTKHPVQLLEFLMNLEANPKIGAFMIATSMPLHALPNKIRKLIASTKLCHFGILHHWIRCKKCGFKSYNTDDIDNKFCTHCKSLKQGEYELGVDAK